MAQRILLKDSGLGSSNNPLSGYKFIGYNGLTFSQLDSNGNIIAIGGSGSGSGLNTASNGLSVLGDSVQIGGFLNQNTTIDGSGQELNLDGLLNFSVTASQTIQLRSIDGSGFDKYLQVSNSDVSLYSGDISTYSTVYVSDTVTYLKTSVVSGDYSFISAEQGQVYLETVKGSSASWIRIPDVSESVSDGSTNNNMIINDDISAKGLVYYGDYSANFTTYSLVTKGYVDALSFGGGLSGTGTTDYLPKWTGSSTLGDSIIRENGTNVSIGTAPSSLQYVKISDSRNISDWYKEGLSVESSSATFSRGIYVSMSNTKFGTGIYVQYKSNVMGDSGTSIASIMSGPGNSHLNHSNTITGGALTSPVGSSNTNIANWIHNDYKRTSSAMVNISNTNNGEGNSLFGINTIMAGTAISVYGESIQINSTATDKIRGVSSIISGSSSASSTGVYIETTHPFDNSKSYGIVVNSGKSVFNDGENSYSDFQIKGDTNVGLFYADVSADNIGIGTINPNTQSILDLSSTTKGFLPPRMTADEANAAFGTQSTAPDGMIIYITATSSDPAVNQCFFEVGWYGKQDAPGVGYFGASGGFNWVKFGYYSYG